MTASVYGVGVYGVDTYGSIGSGTYGTGTYGSGTYGGGVNNGIRDTAYRFSLFSLGAPAFRDTAYRFRLALPAGAGFRNTAYRFKLTAPAIPGTGVRDTRYRFGLQPQAGAPPFIPAQIPGAAPVCFIELAFGNPNGAPVWIDVSSYVTNVNSDRGRQRELDQFKAGTLSFQLLNNDRRFDPTNTAGPYYGQLLPMTRVRWRATFNNSNYYQFQGYIQSWGQEWPGPFDAVVPVTAVDAFLPINLAQLNTTFPIQPSDQRVNAVLSNIGWTVGGAAWTLNTSALNSTAIIGPTGDRSVSPGTFSVQASTLANTSALTHLQDVAQTEMGLLFVDHQGAVTFYGFTHAADLTSKATFGEQELLYVDLTLSLDDTNIWNQVAVTRVGGVQQIANDSVSQAQYFLRTLSITNTLQTSDSNSQWMAASLLTKYAQPGLQILSITLDGAANPDLIYPQMLAREIGEVITVIRRPPGGAGIINQLSVIQGIAVSFNAEGAEWSVTWRLAPIPPTPTSFWILGDASLGVLNSTTILF